MYPVQRRSPRIQLDSMVIMASSQGQAIGTLENISLHGALVRSNAAVPVGGVAEINFRGPGLPFRRTVKAAGVVVRADSGRIALDLQKMDLDSLFMLRGIHSRKVAENVM